MLPIGEKLRNWRKERHITLQDAARDLHVSISVVSEWERGLLSPSARHVRAIAEYMNVPLCWLFHENTITCPHLKTSTPSPQNDFGLSEIAD